MLRWPAPCRRSPGGGPLEPIQAGLSAEGFQDLYIIRLQGGIQNQDQAFDSGIRDDQWEQVYGMHRRRQPHLEDLPGFLGPKVPALSQDLVQKALSGTRAISLQQFLLIPKRLAESEGLVRPVHVQEPHRVDVEQDSDRVEDGRAEDLVDRK